MALGKNEALARIEGHRRAIREHIEKFYNYPYRQDKEFALKTIYRCQSEIESLKSRCSVYIESSWEDTWTAPYYALTKEDLIVLRNELASIIESDQKKLLFIKNN